jgi:hypothetical protein
MHPGDTRYGIVRCPSIIIDTHSITMQ